MTEEKEKKKEEKILIYIYLTLGDISTNKYN